MDNMVMFLTTSAAIVLTEAFTGGTLLGLAVYGAIKHKKVQKIKVK